MNKYQEQMFEYMDEYLRDADDIYLFEAWDMLETAVMDCLSEMENYDD